MAKLDYRGLRFRGWITFPDHYWQYKPQNIYVFDNREEAIHMGMDAFPNETTLYVQEVNYFNFHMEVDLGRAAIISRYYNQRCFQFGTVHR